MNISLIIPALNERDNLPLTIAAARAALPDAEIIVADGGSIDGTAEWVRQTSGVRLVESPTRGRGPQMNAGAAACDPASTVLLFLHADCLLPTDAGRRIENAVRETRVQGGCFPVRFAETRPVSLPLTAFLINGQSRVRRTATGDQAIWVRRSAWERSGGYKPWPLFEDIDLVDRLKGQAGRRAFVVLRGTSVTISARRWLALGVARTSLWMCVLWLGYKAGVSPIRLKRWFTDVRPKKKD